MQASASPLPFLAFALFMLGGCSGSSASQLGPAGPLPSGGDSGQGGGQPGGGQEGGQGTPPGGNQDASIDVAIAPGTDAGAPDVAGGPDVGPVFGDAGSTGDSGGVMVTWGGGCWYVESGNKYQAMQFQLVTPNPIPLEGTLYFTTDCNASQGTDNLNDTGGTIGSGGWLFWFIHHPNMPSTSAVWSLGNQYSGCIDYMNAPNCN